MTSISASRKKFHGRCLSYKNETCFAVFVRDFLIKNTSVALKLEIRGILSYEIVKWKKCLKNWQYREKKETEQTEIDQRFLEKKS